MFRKSNSKRLNSKLSHHLNETDYTNILARLYSRLWWQILLGLAAIYLYSNFTFESKIEDAVKSKLNSRGTQITIDSLFKDQYNKILNLEFEYSKKYKNAYNNFDSRLEKYLSEITNDTSNTLINFNNGFINIEEGLISINTSDKDSIQKFKIEYNSITSTLKNVTIRFKKKFSKPPKVFITYEGSEFRRLRARILPKQNKFLPLITLDKVTTDYASVTVIGNSYKDENHSHINTTPHSFNWLAIGK